MGTVARCLGRTWLVRDLTVAGAALAIAWSTPPASAYVAHITTSVSVQDAQDESRVNQAIASAVDDVLSKAIAFRPTLVVLTGAVVLGDRLYVELLIADGEGEQMFDRLPAPREPEPEKIGI